MTFPLLVALGSVAVGTALGLGLGRRALGVARGIAAVVAVLAVALQLAPEAVTEVGWLALAVLAGGFVLPLLVELIGQRAMRGSEAGPRLALELAYVGLLVHQLGDGLALGALGSGVHDHGHEVSVVALGVHAIAMSAVFVLAFRDALGARAALIRGLGMAGALSLGAAAVSVLPAGILIPAHPWVAAATAGLLLHVALHPLVHRLTHRAHAPPEPG